VYHAARRLHEARLTDMVTSFFLFNDRANVRGHFVVTPAPLHHGIKIVIEEGKKAGSNLSI
jgi:hypothetical protein